MIKRNEISSDGDLRGAIVKETGFPHWHRTTTKILTAFPQHSRALRILKKYPRWERFCIVSRNSLKSAMNTQKRWHADIMLKTLMN